MGETGICQIWYRCTFSILRGAFDNELAFSYWSVRLSWFFACSQFSISNEDSQNSQLFESCAFELGWKMLDNGQFWQLFAATLQCRKLQQYASYGWLVCDCRMSTPIVIATSLTSLEIQEKFYERTVVFLPFVQKLPFVAVALHVIRQYGVAETLHREFLNVALPGHACYKIFYPTDKK